MTRPEGPSWSGPFGLSTTLCWVNVEWRLTHCVFNERGMLSEFVDIAAKSACCRQEPPSAMADWTATPVREHPRPGYLGCTWERDIPVEPEPSARLRLVSAMFGLADDWSRYWLGEQEIAEFQRWLALPGSKRWFLALLRSGLRLRGVSPRQLLLQALSKLVGSWPISRSPITAFGPVMTWSIRATQ